MKQENNTDGTVHIFEMNSYVKPPVEESASKEWVLNGRNNEFFGYIIDRYNGSPTNAAIINGFTELIYGKGLTVRMREDAEFLKLFPKDEVRKIVSDFKLFGSSTVQVIYSKGKGELRKVVRVHHIPRESIAPAKMNESGDIDTYYYSKDWSKTRGKAAPTPYPAFGTTKDAPVEIMCIQPYKAGKHYFADPDYLSALQYANLEEEISNYSVSHIQNGLSAGYIINFNNGVPEREKREQIKYDIQRKLQGSDAAGNVIISFNDNSETAPTIVPIPSNATHEQWQFWVSEARTQIMVGHRVTSPMLFGIKDNSGLGNNAEELETASKLLQATVIAPMQELLLDAFSRIAAANGQFVEFEFRPLVKFVEEDGTVNEGEEAVELKKAKSAINTSHIAEDLVEYGEDIDEEEWELIEEHEINGVPEDMEVNLARSFGSKWSSASEQDNDLFRVRYTYAPTSVSTNSRDFCAIMVAANKVYRKEDIIAAGERAVNAGFGADGASTYSIWKYKGGPNCKHFWQRRIYLKRNNGKISVNEARNIINGLDTSDRAGARLPVNESEVAKRPTDMPNNGYKN